MKIYFELAKIVFQEKTNVKIVYPTPFSEQKLSEKLLQLMKVFTYIWDFETLPVCV